MDIEYKGGNCVLINTKKLAIVVDPRLSNIGLKDQGERAHVQILTQPNLVAPHGEGVLVIDGPGEYEVENVSIKGVPALAYLDAKGSLLEATMYRLSTIDLSVAIIGHVQPTLTEEQLEDLGVIDALIVPIGGNGFTLDTTGAVQIIKAIDPKIVIPTHYAEQGVSYEVPQAPLDTFIKELGAPQEEVTKLKLKAGQLGESLTTQVLRRTL